LDGTIWNKAEIGAFHDVIDAALAPLEAIPLHASRHAAGGSDPVNVTTLGGYPGGTALFLRADGSFALPGAGTVSGDIVMTTDGSIRRNTTDGSDTGWIALSGGGASATPARGGDVTVTGNELAGFPGVVRLRPGQVTGSYVSVERTDGNVALHVDGASGVVTAPYGLGATPLNAANLTGTIAVARLPAHASTHFGGGSDQILINQLGGYPQNTTTFLRGDGTFAAPGGGAPTAHAPTHNAGGSDPITALSAAVLTSGTLADARLSANIPRLDTFNVFQRSAQFVNAGPGTGEVWLGSDAAGPWEIAYSSLPGAPLVVTKHSAALATHVDVLSLTESGDAALTRDLSVGRNLVVTGTITADAGKRVLSVTGGFPGGTALYLRADGTFAAPPGGGGTGDVVGPASSVDTQVARFSGTTGKLIKASNVTIDDGGVLVAAGLGGTPLNATNLTSGTLPDTRLTVNVLRFAGGFPGGTSTFLRADGTFATASGGGGGDVVGPASATDNAIARYDGATGKLLQNSNATIDDTGVLTLGNALVLPNNRIIAWRNAANTTNITGIYLDAGDALHLGAGVGYTDVGSQFIPQADATHNLGHASFRWKDGFFSGTVTAAGLGATPLNATQLTTGTLPNARLTADVLRFTGGYPGGTTTFLRADGSFAAPPGAVPAGVTQQIQFNDGGVFGAHNGLKYDKTGIGVLYLTGSISMGPTLQATSDLMIQRSTADGADTGRIAIVGGGDSPQARGASVWIYGNENASAGGFHVYVGNVAGARFDVFRGDGLNALSIDGVTGATTLAGALGIGAAPTSKLSVKQSADAQGGGLRLVRNASAVFGELFMWTDNQLYLQTQGAGNAYIAISTTAVTVSGALSVSGTLTGAAINGTTISGTNLAISTSSATLTTMNSSNAQGAGIMVQRNGVQTMWLGHAAPHGIGGNADDTLVYSYTAGSKLYLEANQGSVRSQTMYADVTGTGSANVVVESDGRVRRVTSSRRYKTAIEPLRDWRWLLDLAPVYFDDKQTPGTRRNGGLLAEDVAAHGPRAYERPIFAGLDRDAQPDDVAYTQLLAPMIVALQELSARLDALEGR
jgi:hypothetical protein